MRRLIADLQRRRVHLYGTSVKRPACFGRTAPKCRRSVVAIDVSLSRSAIATTLASTIPIASYSPINSSMRRQSRAWISSTDSSRSAMQQIGDLGQDGDRYQERVVGGCEKRARLAMPGITSVGEREQNAGVARYRRPTFPS